MSCKHLHWACVLLDIDARSYEQPATRNHVTLLNFNCTVPHGQQVSNSSSVHDGDSVHEARRAKGSASKDRDRSSLQEQKQERRKRRRASRSASPSRGGTLARIRRSGVGDGAARKKPTTGGGPSLQMGLTPLDMQVGRGFCF